MPTHRHTIHAFTYSVSQHNQQLDSKYLHTCCCGCWKKRAHIEKASHAIVGRAVKSESVAQRWLVHGMRKLLWNPFKQRGSNFWKSHEESWRLSSQSQPLSFIMWESSIMNLPSLYFWLISNARSCKRNTQKNNIVKNVISWLMLIHKIVSI